MCVGGSIDTARGTDSSLGAQAIARDGSRPLPGRRGGACGAAHTVQARYCMPRSEVLYAEVLYAEVLACY